jgi:hypothetical protein
MKLYGNATEIGAQIVERFKNPAGLPAPLANVFIRRKDASPCRAWSWRNQFLVAIAGYSEARGYRQWQEVGRHVVKGQKAIYILAPCTKKVEGGNEKGEPEERTAVYGFRSVAVFGYEQTDGQPLPGDEENAEWIKSLPLLDVADSWGIQITTYDGAEHSMHGYFAPSRNLIALGLKSVSTWCHELCHVADHKNVGGLKPGQRVDQETVAQLGSAVLLTALEMPVEADLGKTWEYIEHYAAKEKREVVDVCVELLDRTCKAVDLILKTAESMTTAVAA